MFVSCEKRCIEDIIVTSTRVSDVRELNVVIVPGDVGKETTTCIRIASVAKSHRERPVLDVWKEGSETEWFANQK